MIRLLRATGSQEKYNGSDLDNKRMSYGFDCFDDSETMCKLKFQRDIRCRSHRNGVTIFTSSNTTELPHNSDR